MPAPRQPHQSHMPPSPEPSFTQLLRAHIRNTEEKLDELCGRTENNENLAKSIQRELIGELGDDESQQVCIKSQIKELQTERKSRDQREKFWKVVASGGIVAALSLIIERAAHMFGR